MFASKPAVCRLRLFGARCLGALLVAAALAAGRAAEAPSGRAEISAEEILAQVHAGRPVIDRIVPAAALVAAFDAIAAHPQDFGAVTAAVFQGCEVSGEVHWIRQALPVGVTFQSTRFDDTVDLRGSRFHALEAELTVFEKSAVFTGLQLDGPGEFKRCEFRQDLFCDGIQGGPGSSLAFFGVEFSGRAYFDGARLPELRFATPDPRPGQLERRIYSPCVFSKIAVFRGLAVADADFTEVEFEDYADFIGTRFRHSVRFLDADFQSEADFIQAEFPPIGASGAGADEGAPAGLLLDRTHFDHHLDLSWGQLVEPSPWWAPWRDPKTKVNTSDPSTWAALESAFGRSDNLEGRSESEYRHRLMEGSNPWSWFLWGYGFRPLRLFVVLLGVLAAFTLLYHRHPPGATAGTPASPLGRWISAVRSSVTVAWKLDFDYEQVASLALRRAILAEAVLAKVILFFLLEAVATGSPFLSSLLGRLLPGG